MEPWQACCQKAPPTTMRGKEGIMSSCPESKFWGAKKMVSESMHWQHRDKGSLTDVVALDLVALADAPTVTATSVTHPVSNPDLQISTQFVVVRGYATIQKSGLEAQLHPQKSFLDSFVAPSPWTSAAPHHKAYNCRTCIGQKIPSSDHQRHNQAG